MPLTSVDKRRILYLVQLKTLQIVLRNKFGCSKIVKNTAGHVVIRNYTLVYNA